MAAPAQPPPPVDMHVGPDSIHVNDPPRHIVLPDEPSDESNYKKNSMNFQTVGRGWNNCKRSWTGKRCQ